MEIDLEERGVEKASLMLHVVEMAFDLVAEMAFDLVAEMALVAFVQVGNVDGILEEMGEEGKNEDFQDFVEAYDASMGAYLK